MYCYTHENSQGHVVNSYVITDNSKLYIATLYTAITDPC